VAPIDIEFDPEKDRRNLAKHGLSLTLVLQLDWETLLVFPDLRHHYGEDRFMGYGKIGGRLHCVIYTVRAGTVRVISLRKANLREVFRYGQTGQTYH
jgi:uncharacterized DUF497 family protein